MRSSNTYYYRDELESVLVADELRIRALWLQTSNVLSTHSTVLAVPERMHSHTNMVSTVNV